MDVTVRAGRPADVESVQRVARRAWHAAHDDIVGPDVVDAFLQRHYDEESLVEPMSDDRRVFLVATARDRVVGFAGSGPTDEADGTWSLSRIYVHPDRWGEGVGSALLDDLEQRLRDRGADRLRLVVMAGNDVGIGFYEARGFTRTDERYDEHLDVAEYVYAKSL
jgi:ribosomal protein S18 acetylase RimI-like enzyme